MKKLILFAFLAMTSLMSAGIITDAFAHKEQNIGDYNVGVGWKNEPPVEGIPNAVEIVIEMASHSDDGHTDAQHQEATLTLEALIKLDGEKTFLTLVEIEEGLYHAQYTPMVMGFPSVDLDGTLGDTNFASTFHPEKVEALSALAPLKQLSAGIEPQDIMCKDNLTLVFSISEKPACVTSSGEAKLIELGWIATT